MNLKDQATFEAVYREHYGLVAYALRTFRVPPEDKDELIQEVFLRLFQQADRVDASKVKAFLVVTAKNLLIDRYRRTVRQKTEAVGDTETMPQERLWESDGQHDLELAVAGKLIDEIGQTKEGRDFALFYREGLTLKEIGERHGEPIGTIAARVARARTKFKDRLRQAIEELR